MSAHTTQRKVRIGKVVSNKMQKSIVVAIERRVQHPLYKNPMFQEKIAYGDQGCPYTCPFYGKEIDYKSLVCAVAEDVCRRLICVTQVHAPYSLKDMQDIMTAFRKIMDNRGALK